MLNYYRFEIGRYPKDLQEFVRSGDEISKYLRGMIKSSNNLNDLLQGQNIQYRCSEDGKTAFLDGKDVFDSIEWGGIEERIKKKE
jgi:hypothetical protein